MSVARFDVFTVKDNPKNKDKPFWTRVGTAFRHKRGEGFNVVLDALPVDGKLVVLPHVEEREGGGGHE